MVGNGKEITFWHDWWCGDTSLAESRQITNLEQIKVKDFITENKVWDSPLIANALGSNDIDVVTNILIPKRAEVEDTPCWVASSNGKFSVKSAYNCLANNSIVNDSWDWIWHLKVPAKLQGFLWTCMHGKLLTNQHRKLRGLTDNDSCPKCDSGTEDLKHLFFDCSTSANIWSRLPNIQVLTTGELEDWRNWLKLNTRNSRGNSGSFSSSVLTLVTLWNIWIMRNKKVFDNIDPNPVTVYTKCLQFASEIIELSTVKFGPISRTTKLISWNFPGAGKLKLNTDGSSRGNPGPAGYGGVFREERGFWVLGFYGKLDDCTSLEAELWGIFRGLELVQSQGMEAVEIDSDSTAAIALIMEEAPTHSPYLVLIQECKALMASTGCSLKHIYREGNKVADKLANIGVEQEHKWVSHISPPADIIPLLEADMRGVAFERD